MSKLGLCFGVLYSASLEVEEIAAVFSEISDRDPTPERRDGRNFVSTMGIIYGLEEEDALPGNTFF